MSIGKNTLTIILCFAFFPCLSSCAKVDKTGKNVVTRTVENLGIQEIKTRLSGIWYHTQTISTQETVRRKYSWGVTEYDYRNALCIDLLGSADYCQYADGGWKNVMIDLDHQDPSIIFLHLGNPGSPAVDEAKIQLEVNKMTFNFTNGENTLFAQAVNGEYFKLAGPGTQNLGGAR